MQFGEYLYAQRLSHGINVLAMARSIQAAPDYYLEVERKHKPAFTPYRLTLLKQFLFLNEQESQELDQLAAESWKKYEKSAELRKQLLDDLERRNKELGADYHLESGWTIEQLQEMMQSLDEFEKKLKEEIRKFNAMKLKVRVADGESSAGKTFPKQIMLQDQTYEVDKVDEIREKEMLGDHKIGDEYILRIKGRGCHLYREGEEWFVLKKTGRPAVRRQVCR
jgi:hypothetical protein